ncbi:AI-2E family transporter [Parendozoicomonas haliclonae]|uniref:Pheromone autoinducer 2 transporter n=1 Tax=Parendozoicomonas haliclonae TaxID=1960125 RepID=A0A1X7APU1_9GAMM|nr:AI-2E family transporter [Parendozoicomonas haliclonae]SMA50109.1 pheromone autoinducer 2 transporter [Parendozoicomonas haliclonae]
MTDTPSDTPELDPQEIQSPEELVRGMTVSQRGLLLALVIFTGLMVYLLGPVLTPFLVSMVLAYLGDPIADRLENLGLGRTTAVCTVFAFVILLLVLALLVVIPGTVRQLHHAIQLLPELGNWLQTTLVPWLSQYVDIHPELFNLKDLSATLSGEWQKTGSLLKYVGGAIGGSTMTVITFFTNLFLIPVVTFYLLRDWDRLIANVGQMIPRNLAPTVSTLSNECDDVLASFLKGQLIVMCLLGLTYGLGLWLVGLQFAMLVGLIAGLASIVPYMGFIVGIGVALVMALFQFDTWLPVGGVVIVFMIGQMLEGMVFTPLLVGDKIGLHPVAVIFAIMAGGQLFGFTGVLLALPVAAVIMVLLVHLYGNYKGSHLYHASNES